MKRLLRFDFLIPLIMLIGIMQYANVAFELIMSGNISIFAVDTESLYSAGPLRYLKDLFVILFSFGWVLLLPSLFLPLRVTLFLRAYFMWLLGVVLIGSLGFLFEYSPIFFYLSGIRWLLLLHASFGVFILSFNFVKVQNRHPFIFKFLVILALCNGYAVALQFQLVSSLWGMAFGSARLTGLFGSAGVSAFFAIAVALFSSMLDGASLKGRMWLTVFSFFIALSAGSRFSMGAIFLIFMFQIWEWAESSNINLKGKIKLMIFPIFIVMITMGYQSVNEQVDRGDALTSQLGKGGRVSNFMDALDILSNAEIGELLVGRGLGIGTNTAISQNYAEGVDPDIYRFNKLMDNAFVTCFFQFGILGSFLFWWGIYNIINFAKPKSSTIAKHRYIVVVVVFVTTLLLGNPLEQYFLMMSYAAALGAAYWSDQYLSNKILGVVK